MVEGEKWLLLGVVSALLQALIRRIVKAWRNGADREAE